MSIKGLGAILVVTGCGWFGFSLAAGVRQQEQNLNQVIRVLHMLEAELQYRLTPLPELCRLASKECSGKLKEIFRELEISLLQKQAPDAASCMDEILEHHQGISGRMRKHLHYLGRSMGRFDLPGQLNGLKSVRASCESDLLVLRDKQDVRVRSYQTLSLCAGIALAILFM